MEVGPGGVFGEGEKELYIVCIGDDVESVCSDYVGQRCHVCVEEDGAD